LFVTKISGISRGKNSINEVGADYSKKKMLLNKTEQCAQMEDTRVGVTAITASDFA